LIKKYSKEYFKGVKYKYYGKNGNGSMSWYYSKEKTIEEIRKFQIDRPNHGNAPAMRSAPIGLIKEEFINDYATINANATHPNINAIRSSQCIARAARFILIEDGNPQDIIHYCQKTIPLNQEYEDYLSKVDQLGNYENFQLEDFVILCGHQPIKKPYFLSGIHGIPSDSKYTAQVPYFLF
jgi:ADP-ribosylglycohydrolase